LTSWFCADRFARKANLDVLPDRKVSFFLTQWSMRVAAALALRNGDREKLARIASSRAAGAGLARRARIVLLAAEGLPHTEVARRAGVSVPVVREWRSRYQAAGIRALEDLPRSGRPKTVDETKIVVTTLERPPEHLGVTHWSSRLLARELGISSASIAETWRKWGLQPWRRQSFKFSTDPQLEAKLTDSTRPPPPNPAASCTWSATTPPPTSTRR
jgi:transposase